MIKIIILTLFLLSCSDKTTNLVEKNFVPSINKEKFDSLEGQCSCDRFYLQEDFDKYIKQYSKQYAQQISSPNVLPKKCFILGLKKAEIHGGPFKHSGYLRCENQEPKECLIDKNCNTKSCKYASRPCVNKKYVSVMHSAFLEVNKCLGLDARFTFPLYMHESQLHLSRRSWTGALCSGQMTSVAVEDVNRSDFSVYKNNPDCKKVFKHFKMLKTKVTERGGYRMLNSARCGITSNPYSCFMYSLMVYKKNFTRMQKLRVQFDLKSIFIEPEKVLESVGVWSYNGGYGVIRILKLYLQNHSTDKNISFVMFWKDFKNNWISKYYKWGGPARVKEVQNFAEKVARDLIKAPNSPEGHLYIPGRGKQGALCSDPSSFVNDDEFIKEIMKKVAFKR
ncbi:MAG: hypothetical protein HAW60_05290 [Bdellovibrionales bacterium]|nr:hypothetical protein [Bdellovibrionales bacterium]